jgi:thiol:disulfide interchange protein DsbD
MKDFRGWGVILSLVLVSGFCFAAGKTEIKTDTVTVFAENQHNVVEPKSKSAIAVRFDLKEGWHFYASPASAPGGMNLKLKADSDIEGVSFKEPIFPDSQEYQDKLSGKKVDAFSGKFSVYIPFETPADLSEGKMKIEVQISGAICSDTQCRMPNFDKLISEIKVSSDADMADENFTIFQPEPTQKSNLSVRPTSNWSVWFALIVAFAAGVSLNIMPCVWPVLPVIVMRIIDQAKKGRRHTILMGLGFCGGIILFFACLAVANIILQVFYGSVLQWGDQYRNPAVLGGIGALLVVLALFMFDVFTISLPGSVSSKQTGTGISGSIGMGFLAAVLSTPCSFAILAAAFAWAQTQPIFIATVAILVIGVGMAVPYFVLVMIPGWLGKIPKPGRWMDLFKHGVGFILLLIAVKLISALPEAHRINLVYYSVILAICSWIWGKWVRYDSKAMVKWTVRILAIVIAVGSGWGLFVNPQTLNVDWVNYDEQMIEQNLQQGKPVLIKFTADWCLSCKVVDKLVYGKPQIAELLKDKNVLTVKADTTLQDYPATKALKNIYNQPGVPVTILHLPNKEEYIRWNSLNFADELKRQLKAIEPNEKKSKETIRK